MTSDANDTSRLTSGEVSRLTGVPLQTLIRWERSGVLTAKRLTSADRSPRRYDEAGLVAALFAGRAARMGFSGDHLAELIGLIQAGDRKTLRQWLIYSYQTGPGLMAHDCQEKKIATRHVQFLKDEGRLVENEPTDLWTVRQGLVAQARSLLTMPDVRL